MATDDGAARLCPDILSSVPWFLGPSSRRTDLPLVPVLFVAIVSWGVCAWESLLGKVVEIPGMKELPLLPPGRERRGDEMALGRGRGEGRSLLAS